jgi:hypothetical protein
MAKQFDRIGTDHAAFIRKQHLFFTASATADSRINLSPKGQDALRVLDDHSVCWLDLTGSGNETAAHMRHDGRLTVMFCAFQGPPMILRLYGRGETLARGTAEYGDLLKSAFDDVEPPGARQIVQLSVDMVQTSCGFAVPLYDYQGERDSLIRWAENKGDEGLEAYRQEKNRLSIDGLDTGLA